MLDVEKMELLRKKLGLTQEQAAKGARLPGRAYWNDVVKKRKANVTLDVLGRIAATLKCSPRDLLK